MNKKLLGICLYATPLVLLSGAVMVAKGWTGVVIIAIALVLTVSIVLGSWMLSE